MTTQHLLDDLPMRPLQIAAVALCVTLSALDGFDVLAISFAAPGIAEAWNISAAALGIVLSMELAVVAAVAGLFTNSAVVGLYAMFARSFPTHLRASGTGFVIGVGRAGAVLGPVIAGYLFDAGFALPAVSLVMALGSLIALCLLVFFRERQNG